MNQLIWLQRDLRLQDHAPIQRALANKRPILFAYFHDPKQAQGRANQAWLAASLETFSHSLAAKGGSLVMPDGDFDLSFARILTEYDISEVLYHFELGEPYQTVQQHALKLCQEHQVRLTPFDQAWLAPETLLTQQNRPYGVYTPFSKKLLSLIDQVPKAKGQLDWRSFQPVTVQNQADLSLPVSLQECQEQPWAKKIMVHWQVGEAAAWQQAKAFLSDGVKQYAVNRDIPSSKGTSQLSIHLHFGEINSIALLQACLKQRAEEPQIEPAVADFIRQLIWREFARYLLFFNPKLQTQAYQEKFNHLQWPASDQNLIAWQKGQTGIPIIDAGMRQLWQTGWMHNRVRMLVASWLTKNLNQHWLIGQHWFEDTLLDADIPNNSMGWQWVAGCGVDAAPYFRLFNPVVQSEKFDPHGHYIRTWLPEISPLPNTLIHAPWQAQKVITQQFPSIAKHYPLTDPDLKQARLNHQQRVQALKVMTMT